LQTQGSHSDEHGLSPNDSGGLATDLVGARVLVIDDSNTIRRSAEIFLRQGGHEVLLAEDGFDALSKISDHDPELIFCDILMPRLDGYQTCAIIKRNPRFAHVPVIMLSSKDGLFDKARGRMVGSQDYLTKPFTKEQLLRAVDDYRRTAFPTEFASELPSEFASDVTTEVTASAPSIP
jgi:twitching motility two-component system response regulator PilG